MSNKISRRAFLKVTGVSALALGAASMLGGCQSSSGSVEVKVGDKVSNWNNLGVQLSSVFTLSDAPDVAGHQYVAVLVTAVNRSKTDSMAIGAQNIAEIDAAYPLTDEASRAANTAPYFHALSASTTDFRHRGRPGCRGRRLHLPVRRRHGELLRCAQPAPAGHRLH